MKKFHVVPAIAALTALAACSATPDASHSTDMGTGVTGTVRMVDVITASNALGISMLDAAPSSGNAVVSPLSASYALAVLAPGASGTASADLERLLGANSDDALTTLRSFRETMARYVGGPEDFDPTQAPESPFLHIANQVVIAEGFEASSDYLYTVNSVLEAESITANISDDNQVLDEFVSENTAGLIEESAIEPDPSLRLVIQNAMLFGASWETPFDPSMTQDRPFTTGDGTEITVPMMHDGLDVAYVENDGWQAIELPYTVGFTATIILPPDGVAPLSEGVEAFSARVSQISAALDSADTQVFSVFLPTLDTASSTNLVQVLENLSADGLLSQAGDAFTGIAPGLALGQAEQQTVLQMNEEGTVAAATTEIGLVETSAPAVTPAPEFVADHPYFVSISEDDTGWDIIQAVINDPTL